MPISGIHKNFAQDMFLRNLLIVVVFYIHFYLLFPLIKKRNGKSWYSLFLLICFCLFFVISEYLRPKAGFIPMGEINMHGQRPENSVQKAPPFRFFFILPPFIAAILSSYCYMLLLNFNKREKALNVRENAQLKTELNFLRSQISPHFMFNVLNSMVSLARKKSPLLEPSLINMSSLMRYMLYERNGSHIFLNTEVEYLKNYIDLQLLRYGDTVKLNMYITGKFESYSIEPMLLIPFVENAFKHGLSMVENPLIDIFLTLNNSANTLQFVVLNNISPVEDMKETAAESETGIGLQNIQRRLELLYPNKAKLNITQKDDVYKAELLIKLI